MGCGCDETQHHYLDCQAKTWTPILKKKQQDLSRRLADLNTSPTIIAIIIYSITHHYSTQNTQWPSSLSESDVYAYQAASSQQRISWHNFVKGRHSKLWIQAQQQYFQELYKTTKLPKGTIDKWKTSFLPTILQYGLDLWDQRNQIVHGSTPEEAQKIKRRNILKEVKQKFIEGRKSVAPPQERLFHKPEVLQCRQRTSSLQQWLYAVNIAQGVRKEQLEKLRQQCRPLRHYGFQFPKVIRENNQLPTAKTSTGYQQTLRELFLVSNPTVRKRELTFSSC